MKILRIILMQLLFINENVVANDLYDCTNLFGWFTELSSGKEAIFHITVHIVNISPSNIRIAIGERDKVITSESNENESEVSIYLYFAEFYGYKEIPSFSSVNMVELKPLETACLVQHVMRSTILKKPKIYFRYKIHEDFADRFNLLKGDYKIELATELSESLVKTKQPNLIISEKSEKASGSEKRSAQ